MNLHTLSRSHPEQPRAQRRIRPALLLTLLLLLALASAACGQEATPEPTSPPATGDEQPAPAQIVQEPQVTVQVSQPTAPATPAQDGPTATQTLAPSPTPSQGRIVIWHSWAGADGDALAQILARAQDALPNLTVETLFVAYDDLLQSYADAVAAGGGPDILLAPSWWLQEMADAQLLQPLDPALTPALQNDYWPAAVENLTYQGELYGLPTSIELVSLFYNRGLVGPDQLPTTTEELLALAQADPGLGSGLYANFYHLYWGIPAYGGRLFDESGRVVLDQDPGAAQFLAWLKALNDTPGSYVDFDYGRLLDRFKKGEVAFFVDGPWALAELREVLGEDLGVTLLPGGPAGPARPWLSADGAFFNPNSSPQAQAWALEFARFLTNQENSSLLARTANRLPAHVQADLGEDPLRQGFLRQAQDALPEPHRPEMANLWGYAGDMILKVVNGVLEPQEAVAEATTLINEANGK